MSGSIAPLGLDAAATRSIGRVLAISNGDRGVSLDATTDASNDFHGIQWLLEPVVDPFGGSDRQADLGGGASADAIDEQILPRWIARIRPRVSMPSARGICMSSSTTSGR